MATKNVVVFGGTGQQGSAFVRALSALNGTTTPPTYTIHLLSRNTTAPGTTRLAGLPGVKVVPAAANYANAPEEAFAAAGLGAGEVYGVFSLQGYISAKEQERQGIAIADAADKLGVRHIIQASADFPEGPSGWDDLEAKRNVENHIKNNTKLGWTFLGAVDFMDNYLADNKFVFKLVRTVVLNHTFTDPNHKIQMISTRDIGRAGAQALAEPDKWINKKLPLVGDSLTPDEVKQVYREVMGSEVETTYSLLAIGSKWALPVVAELSKFYNEIGTNLKRTDTEAIIDVEDFRTFLQRHKREAEERAAPAATPAAESL